MQGLLSFDAARLIIYLSDIKQFFIKYTEKNVVEYERSRNLEVTIKLDFCLS